jgi:hypothetical protein
MDRMDRIVAYVDCFGLKDSKPIFFNLEIKAPGLGYTNPVDKTSVTITVAGGILRTASSSNVKYGSERSYSAEHIIPIDEYAEKVGAQIPAERKKLKADEQRKKIGAVVEGTLDVALMFVPAGRMVKFVGTTALHMAIAGICDNSQWSTMAEIGRGECLEWLITRFFTMVGVPEAEALINFSSASAGQVISMAQSASEAKMKRPLTASESRMEQIHAFWQFADPDGYQKSFGFLDDFKPR